MNIKKSYLLFSIFIFLLSRFKIKKKYLKKTSPQGPPRNRRKKEFKEFIYNPKKEYSHKSKSHDLIFFFNILI